jgi:STE24 endopeptidase
VVNRIGPIEPSLFNQVVLLLICARLIAEFWLSRLNRRQVLVHANEIPPAFCGFIDGATYRKSVEYTLAKSKLSEIEDGYNVAVLIFFLFSGVLPWSYHFFQQGLGQSAWTMAAFLFAVGFVMSLPGLPFDWFSQFRLEEKFGFNTSTSKTWWTDRLKGWLLALVLGYPLLVLILKIVEWTGAWWWLWAWAALLAFQFLMLVIAPVLILPWFNKFTALHSNAFFTGFGRFRKIVLFDTLVQQLTEPELEAVLAHEIGHYKKKHIPKMLAFSAVSSLIGFYLISILARQEWFYRAFGFEPGNVTPALLLFGLLAGTVTFWLSPLIHWWSRRYEYQADAFAAKVMSEAQSLIGALRKLNEKNLSNLTPHPWYSGFYYSHPTLLEREQALARKIH